MFIASVRPSVGLFCLEPKFGRLKTKFDDDADNTCECGVVRRVMGA